MNLTTPIALLLGPVLAAGALPQPSFSPQAQEPTSERLVDLLQEMGYAGSDDALIESSPFQQEDPAEQRGEEEPFQEESLEETFLTFGAVPEDPEEEPIDYEALSENRLLIGIYTQEPTELLAYHLQVPQEKAVVVTGTVGGYPANRAGLQEHDVIVGVDGKPVATLALLRQALDKKKPGETLTLTVVQQGERKEMSIPLFLPEGSKRSTETGNFFIGTEEEVIEDHNELPEVEYAREAVAYEREAAQLRSLDRQLRTQAMRAEMQAKREAMQQRLVDLDAQKAILQAQRAGAQSQRAAKQSTMEALKTRELSVRAELAQLQASLAEMEARLMAAEAQDSVGPGSAFRARLDSKIGIRGGRRGAWVAGRNEVDGGSAIIFYDEDGDNSPFGRDEEEEDHFDQELFDRMDGFEDRLERIEDLLRRLVDRNR